MTTVTDIFDDWARNGRAEGMERGHGPAARMAFERLKLGRGSHYLDIGCGNGYTVRWAGAASPEGRAVGLDLSPEMIELARRSSSGLANVEFVAGAFPGVELPGRPFDAIFSMEVFYYLPDLDAALRETRSLLRPGGLFVCIVDYYGENRASHSWPGDLGVPMTLLDAGGWSAAFARAGLGVIEQKRLRQPRKAGMAEWKTTEGSLMTLARR
jgi:SAM-dependent methyltransferase